MIKKISKFLLIFLFIFGIIFSNIPFYAVSSIFNTYVKSRNIVDNAWHLQKNSNVVDKFASFRNLTEELKIKETYAATSGQVYPTLGVTIAEDPWLDNNWTTPTNVYSDNAATAYVIAASFDSPDQTFVLKATGFNFSAIPDGSTINGVTARVNAWYRSGQGAGAMDLCQLLDINKAKVGTNQCATQVALTTTNTTIITKGSAADKWGNALDTTWIKDPDFGIAIGIKATAANADVDVDYVTLEIDYTPPANTTTLSTGTNPGNSTIAPGGAITPVNGFTLTTNSGTDAITSITVNLSTNSGVGTLTITDGADAVLGSIGGGTGAGIVTGSNSISISSTNATTGGTAFKVKVTPLSHLNMPVPDGGAYVITGVVTDWAGTNTKAGQANDTSDTVTIDNNSPAGTTGAGATSGESTQSTVSWTNPGDTDFQQVYIYCKTSSMLSGEAPAEGADPAVDATACDTTARMKYKGTFSPQTISSLTNGTPYYFRIYGRDTNGNFTAYSATQEVTGTPSAPAAVLTISASAGSKVANVDSGATSAFVHNTGCSSDGTCAAFKLAAGGGAVSVTSITITETNASLNADTDLANAALIYDTDANYSNGTAGTFGTDATFTSQAVTFTNAGLNIPNASTYYFYIRTDFANGTARPDGGLTVNFQIASATDVISDGTESGSGTLVGTTTILPNITSITYPITTPLNGSRIGQSITINGAGFGTTCDGTNNRVTIGGVGNVVSCTGTTFSDTSISITNFQYSSGDSYGGATTLLARVGATDDNASQDMYVYPDVTSLSVSEAREGDTVTINGNHFGTGAGANTVTIDGVTATGCTWSATALTNCIVPTAINDANNSVTVRAYQGTGGSNSLYDESTGFGILPKIDSISAASFSDGGYQNGTFTLNGSHFGASAGSISVNGQAQDGTPTWGASTITGVGIPDGGTDSGSITLTRSDTKTSNALPNFYIYPQITSFSAAQGDGDVQSATITITGNHFGTGGGNAQILINNVAPSATTPTWGAGSITNVDIPNAGIDSGVIVVTNPTTAKSSNNSSSFVIYPQITGTVDTVSVDAAREYSASDSDGVFTVNGNHFGAGGTVTILGGSATQQTTATCTGSAYQATCVGLRVPDVAGYTGNIIISRTADTKTNTYAGFRVLPRIISTTPVNLKGGRGDTIAITGDHLCQSGTCPSAFSATNSVNFNGGSVTSGASAWTDTSIPSIVIPGTAIDGNLNITSDTSYTSNNLTFNIKFSPSVSDTGRAPSDTATGQSKNLIETGSAFTDGTDGDAQSDSEWQVDEEGTFVTPEWTDSVTNVTSVTINTTDGAFAGNRAGQTELACGTTYSWRFRYKDNGGVTSQEWSAWSNTWTFTTVPCGPDATSVTYQLNSDGARSGYSATITGTAFGTATDGNQANCAGGAGTGCVKFTVGGTATVADADVTAWSDTSISFTVNSALASDGGVAALEVTAANVADTTKLTFYIYPTVSSPGYTATFSDGGYQDGTITITGDHLGSSGATTNISFNGQNPASVGTWTSTSISTVDTPNGGTDSGTITVTRASDSKASNASSNFYIYPQIASFTNTTDGSLTDGGRQAHIVTITGNHFGTGGTIANILINGVAPSSIGTWAVGSVTSVDIPDGGNDSGVITVTNPGTSKTSNNSTSFYIYPTITSFSAAQGDGDVQTATITITGNHFGTGGGNAQILINTVAPSATTPTWGAGSITNVDIPNGGADSGVIVVTNPTTTKSSNNFSTFVIYPQISSLSVPTAEPDAAREYLVSDSDGVVTVNGNHFGVAGSVTVFGSAGTQQTTGTCSGSAYQATCTGIQIPIAIANNSYTGNVIITRTADTKTNTYAGFRVLPRITSTTPVNLKGGRGDTIVIAGDHLCQSGTCPSAFSATNKVSFNAGEVTSGASVWTDSSIPSIVISGTAIDGNLYITSNTSYTSNALTFDIKFSPTSPTNGVPAGLSDVALNPALNGSTFSDGTDGDTHTDSDWQVDEEGTFAAPEWSETLSSVNISITVNNTNGSFANNLSGQTALACSKTYSFRIRYKDNAGVTSQEWSNWSTTSTFTTALCGPNATSVSNSTEPALTDGGRIGHTIVISGTDFGTVSAGNRATCTGNGNGCVKIGGTGGQMIADTRVTAWANTSITISLSLTDLTTTYGGATTSGLIVYRDGVSDASGLTFYVYPDITSLTTPLGTNDGAREYDAGDTDGIITITGNKFGTAPTGGQTVIVGGAVASYVADGTCDAVDGWTETCIKVQVPTTIVDSTDSGYVVVTQGTGSNNKTSNSTDAGGAINIWPRVTGFTGSQSAGGYQSETFTLSGNHFGASAGSITVNGQTQDGTPTWGAASITNVGIPNNGTDSGDIILTKSDTKTSNTFSTFYIYPQITGFTNTTDGALTDGGRQTHVITITGNHFGTGGGNTNITINGIAPSATTPTWGTGSITNVDIPNGGNDSGVIVVANPTTSKSSNNSTAFYIYPQITSLTVPTATPDAAREYLVSDSDGIITVNGNHFGGAGSVTVLGSAGAQQTTGTCSGSAYQATCVGLQIPTAIADSSYTGNIIITRATGGAKDDTFAGFRVLPRIISLNPDNGITNSPIIIIGNHFCQTGTCPLAGSRSTASDNVIFYNVIQVTDGNVTTWGHGDSSTSGVSVNVPATATTGDIVVRTNDYNSNGINFTKASSVPNSPSSLQQYENDDATTITVGNKTNDGVSNNLIFKASMSAGGNYTLCLQIENATVGTAFTGAITAEETGGACESYTGTPVVGSVTLTGLTASNGYHWRARVRNNSTSETSAWVAFGANPSGDGSTDGSPANNDYYIDVTAPVISVISSTGVTASGATITWNTDELADSQVKYDIVCPPVANTTTVSQTGGVYSHSIILSNLTPGITYQYQVVSQDRNTDGSLIGNSATGPSAGTCNTFLTSQANMRTAEFIITGETSAATTETIKDFQVYITEQGYSVQSAFVELTGIAGTGGGNSMTLGLKVEGESGTISYANYTVAIDNAIATPFTILHKIDNSVTDLYIAPTQSTQNKLYINPSSGDSVYIASAKIVVTYYYTP